ncbi:hypothetical protein [Candidatus Contubernalis alkaliaceticus]|uniref:hypothetical protein n=1 Tax=Candidatus Contubernalis alkaliaceticus TaxID=338645 RepID=UPI001F4C1BC9|nr:hypothetical protein [Candidatus Contubernalis alkalaceticus]UNC91660.1 hypothetical protein HUE98_05875 [Candidatus Contubernalis alkalaceticus]
MPKTKEPIGTAQAKMGYTVWSVEIYEESSNLYRVAGRGTAMLVSVMDTPRGFLVSVPSSGFSRAGFVPADCQGWDIEEYLDFENPVDAETIATAVRWLIEEGEVIC